MVVSTRLAVDCIANFCDSQRLTKRSDRLAHAADNILFVASICRGKICDHIIMTIENKPRARTTAEAERETQDNGQVHCRD